MLVWGLFRLVLGLLKGWFRVMMGFARICFKVKGLFRVGLGFYLGLV